MSIIDNHSMATGQSATHRVSAEIPPSPPASPVDAKLMAVYEKAGIPIFLDPKTGDVDLSALDRELKRLP